MSAETHAFANDSTGVYCLHCGGRKAAPEHQQLTIAALQTALRALLERWEKERETWPPFGEGGMAARKAIARCQQQLGAVLARLSPP